MTNILNVLLSSPMHSNFENQPTLFNYDDKAYLTYKVKTQYVHLWNIEDTSIKHTNSLQSATTPIGCIYTCFI